MTRIILALACALMLAGCATVNHTPLSVDRSAQLAGKTVTMTRHAAPDFAAFTAGKAVFGGFGAMAMIAEGNEIVRMHQIADPATSIGQGLIERLGSARKVKALPPATLQATSDDAASLATAYPGADYLVDVKTVQWMFNYYPGDWSHYRVTYGARVRLIETSTRQVLAETLCQAVQGDDKQPPTKEQLLDNQAALLKEYLRRAATGCVDVLSRELLGL
jgi:hypothetical protein